MANEEEYPSNSSSYKILEQIGVGANSIVYKAICSAKNSTEVAIKIIMVDDRSREDVLNKFKSITHPNIVKVYCSFMVGGSLWLIMPFFSAGSIESIVTSTSSFQNGLSEECISLVLKDVLKALSHLHDDRKEIHGDIKGSNILLDWNGSAGLAQSGLIWFSLFGNPYWIAPEVKSPNPNLVDGYGMKADIWAFGVTALELALGCPPLSRLPPSNSLLFKKISERFGFADVRERIKNYENNFSEEFQDMVIQCLDADEFKRPSAKILLDHDFFKNCTPSSDYLKLNLLRGLLSIEERFKKKEPGECIFNARRLEFDLGPPLVLSDGGGEGISSRDGSGEGTSGGDGGPRNEIRKKIVILRDFLPQLKERIILLEEGMIDRNNLKNSLETELNICTNLDTQLSLLMLSLMEPEEFVPNPPAIFIQQEPGVVFVVEPIDEIPRDQPFHRALIRLKNCLTKQTEELSKLISLLEKDERKEAHKVAKELADVLLDYKEITILNLKHFLPWEPPNQPEQPNP